MGGKKKGQAGDKTLSGLIADWGGFEKLVAKMHDTGDVTVEHNVKLPAKEDGEYQIDVLLTHRRGPYTYNTIVECKFRGRPIERKDITHLVRVRDQVGADKAVCISPKGFQSGAKATARAAGVKLFAVKELSNEDWGRPGPVLELYLQFYQAAISRLSFPDAKVVAPSGAKILQGHQITNPADIQLSDAQGQPRGTLLSLIERIRQYCFDRIKAKRWLWASGADGVYRVRMPLDDNVFEGGLRSMVLNGRETLVTRFQCDVVLQIRQKKLVIDRRENFDFALVVHDLLEQTRILASRRRGATESELLELPDVEEAAAPDHEVFQNGSIAQLLVGAFLDYGAELEAFKLQAGEASGQQGPDTD